MLDSRAPGFRTDMLIDEISESAAQLLRSVRQRGAAFGRKRPFESAHFRASERPLFPETGHSGDIICACLERPLVT